MAVNINVLSTFNDAGIKKASAEMGKLNKKVTGGLSAATKTAGAMGAGVLGAAGIAIGGLLEIGTTFDGAYDSIRANTGKTGDELESLKGSLHTVATTTATSFGEAAAVIGVLNSKLGLTGKPLEDVTKNLIDLSNLTGTDLNGNVEAVSKAFQNFGVMAEYQAPALDVLYRASQQSGVSVTDLATSMADTGAVLRASGFDFQTSTAFLASLGKAGIDAGDVMPALSRGLKNASKDGKDAGTYLNDTFNAIKNAPNDIEASKTAFDAFGKSGGKMAELIREGKLSYDDLKASIGEGDTISKATEDTEDFAEKFTKLKNRIMAALEPFAKKVFEKVGEAMDFLGPKVDQVSKFFQENEGAMLAAQIAIGALVIACVILTGVMIALAIAELGVTWPMVLFIVLTALVVAAIIYLWVKFDWFREGLIYIAATLRNAFFMIKDALVTAFNAIWDAIQWMWEKFNWLKDGIGSVFGGIKDAIISAFKAAFNMVVSIWNGTVGGLGFDVPDWVPGIGGKSFKVPELTQWAHSGGIVGGMPGANVPMMLQTGEMVLSQDQQAMLLGRTNGDGGGGVININMTVSPTADKASIGQAVVETIREYERRSGSGWRAA
jgi:TP901 family phage tail tape measure protein